VYLLIFLAIPVVGSLSGAKLGANGRTSGSLVSIEFFDVGQGDAALIITPNGRRILIDTGPDYTLDKHMFGGDILNIFRKCHIEMLVITHDHADHDGGTERLSRRCSLGYTGPYYKGEVYEIDGVYLHILWPPKDHSTKDINDLSVVILLDYYDQEVLFTGDVGYRIQDSFTEMTIAAPLNTASRSLLDSVIEKGLDVYKVSHHGSVTGLSKVLLSKYPPKLSVISVGEGNKFGHPNEEVLEFLGELSGEKFGELSGGTVSELSGGTSGEIHRTDTGGSLKIILTGK
jgi:competence protein ComEC